MTYTPGGCRDLRKLMDNEQVLDAFSKLVSGKSGYRTVVEQNERYYTRKWYDEA